MLPFVSYPVFTEYFKEADMTTGKNKFSLSRRTFVKTAAAIGGLSLLSLSVKRTVAAHLPEPDSADALLKGVSDLHVHAAPDTKERLIDELSFARAAQQADYRSIMFKSNEFSCHDRAWLIRQAVPSFKVFGSLCMNAVVGEKVNVHAARAVVQTTGGLCRCIWMPTQSAAYQVKTYKLPGSGIPVLDTGHSVLPEVVKVMEICAEADIIFATGHSSPEESLILAKKAKEVGVKKFVVTHANSGIWKMTYDQIKQAMDDGAFIEYSYITNLWGKGTGLPDFTRMSDREFTDFAKINPRQSFITTDLGQPGMPHPLDGMRRCILALRQAGMSQADINLLVRENPAKLMNI